MALKPTSVSLACRIVYEDISNSSNNVAQELDICIILPQAATRFHKLRNFSFYQIPNSDQLF